MSDTYGASSHYVVVIAARMTSSRLPGKALVSYCPDGTPNLEQIVRRWQAHSRRAPAVIVATSIDPEDDAIAELCRERGVPCARGSRDDVLTRLHEAVQQFAPEAKYIARGMSDSPLVDVGLADWRLDLLAESGADGLWYGGDEARLTYAATTDVWSRAAWERIVASSSGSQREHVGAYFWDNLNQFNVVLLNLPRREYLIPWRTELDTPEDLEMFRQLWRFSDETCLPYLSAAVVIEDGLNFISDINAKVRIKTQTKALWRKGSQWVCQVCRRRAGTIIAGDLEVRCTHCGRPQKFYAVPPPRRVKPSLLTY